MRRIFHWFRPRVNGSIAAAAATIAVASFVSRLLGVFRDRVLAGQFGAGDTLDIYYAAFKIPDLLYSLLIVGALSAGFIPIFVARRQQLTRLNGEHWYLTNAFLSVTLLVMAILALLFAAGIDYIVPWLTPGFSPDKLSEVARLSRIMFLSPVILGISAVMGGVLQSYRQFFMYSLAPIFYNVGIIIGALFFVPIMGITGLAWGVVLGAFLHLTVQLPVVRGLGWRPKLIWDFKNPDLRKIGKLMIPRTMGLSVTQLNIFVLTVIASLLASGSIAIFNLAEHLYFLPVAIFGISYALAAFPELSEAGARGDSASFSKSFSLTVRQILFLIIPATVLLLLLKAQIVRSVLGTGAFGWTDTVLTFQTLQWLSVSLFAQALIPLLARSFYARQNSMTPFIVGVLGDVVTIASAIFLARTYGVVGLAMGFSLGSVVHVSFLWLALHWRIGSLGEKRIVLSLLKFSIASLVMAFVVQGVKTGVGSFLGTSTFLAISTQGTASAVAGIATYAAVLLLLRSDELHDLITALRRKVFTVSVAKEGIDEGEGI